MISNVAKRARKCTAMATLKHVAGDLSIFSMGSRMRLASRLAIYPLVSLQADGLCHSATKM